MVAKPLCPLYKNIIKHLDRARYPELRSILEKAFDTESNKHKYSAFGYWFPHENKAFEKGDKLGKYVVNIKTLEDKTGIDFFCNLPDEIEKEVENVDAEVIKKLWGFK